MLSFANIPLSELMNFFIHSVRALKGDRGKDEEIFAPVGITVTSDDGRKLR